MKKEINFMKKSNKGVALVSIMIAVAFLALIATSMISLSVSNFKMKSANNLSKENYYETQGELVKISAGVRNEFMKSSAPLTAVDNIKDGSSLYDCKEIAKIVYPSASVSGTKNDAKVVVDGDEVHFTSPTRQLINGAKDASGNKKIVLKDFEVYQVSSSSNNEIRNSVKTDIEIVIHESVASSNASGGVGEFSMLMDAPIDCTANNFTSLNLYGNNFIAKYGGIVSWDGGSYTGCNATAIVLQDGSNINFAGDYNVVYGDIVLNGNSCIYATGKLTVFGDIIINGAGGKVIVPGELRMVTECALPGKSAASSIKTTVGSVNNHVYIGSGSVTPVTKQNYKDFCNELGLNNNVTTDDGLVTKVLEKVNGKNIIERANSKTIQGNGSTTGLAYSTGDQRVYWTLTESDKFYGKNIMFSINWNNNMNGGCANCLMINTSSQDVVMKENNINTTYISQKPIIFSEAHNVTMSKIGSDAFNFITADKGDPESAIYRNDKNPFNNIKIPFNLGGDTYTGSVGKWFKPNCNEVVDKMFGFATGGSGGTPTYSSALTFTNFSRDVD